MRDATGNVVARVADAEIADGEVSIVIAGVSRQGPLGSPLAR